MKKIFLFFLTMLLFLSGCNENIKVKEVPQTNEELTIYIGRNDYAMQVAIQIFQKEYPNILINVLEPQAFVSGSPESQLAVHEENSNLLSSLMAGEGPDVLITDSLGYMMNIEKMAANGVFADMSEFYDNDDSLDPTINQAVFNGGVIEGKRYLFPLGYTIPLLLSTQESLRENDFKIEECTDYLSFISETERIMENGKVLLMPTAVPHTLILNKSGINPVNLEDSIISLDLPEIKTSFEWMKKSLASFTENEFYYYEFGSTPEQILSVCSGETLFLCSDPKWGYLDYSQYPSHCQLIASLDKTPILVPIRNVNGGLTANVSSAAFVRANSNNKENAYKLIQILLSKEVQSHLTVRAQAATSILSDAMLEYFESICDSNGGPVKGFPLNRPKFTIEYHNKYMSYTDEIDNIQWYDWGKKVVKYMYPYLLGEEAYEKCLEDAKWNLELELSE